MRGRPALVVAGLAGLAVAVLLSVGVAGASRHGDAAAVKVALVGIQPFGDRGPMDQMAAGLAECDRRYGYDARKFETLTPSSYATDLRRVARAGFQLIFTTFPPMTATTRTVAAEFPKTKFVGIQQFVNVPRTTAANVWDTQFSIDSVMYVYGVVGAELSRTGRLGYVAGVWDATEDAGANAFAQGAKATRPKISIDFVSAESYQDPVKGKRIAQRMIARGVDFIQTSAAETQLGVIDAARDGDRIFVSGDVGDNFARYPNGFVGYLGLGYRANVVQGCRFFANGTLPLGKHTIESLTTGGAYVPYDALTRWGEATGKSALAGRLVALEKQLVARIVAGQLRVVHDTTRPKSIG